MTGDPPAGRRVSRRVLLGAGLAAAGVAVGAGGTAIAGATDPATPAAATVPSPGEELMTEHGVLKRILLSYRAAHDRLAVGRGLDPAVITDAAQIVADYVESFHEGPEEAYVFPRVVHQQGALVTTLLEQHDRGRHLTTRIQAVAADGLTTDAARRTLAADLAAFVRMYEPHEAWEDTVVYPALRQATDPRTLNELAERFHDLENAQYGDQALAAILDRVHGIEEQLAIADLGAFTPVL